MEGRIFGHTKYLSLLSLRKGHRIDYIFIYLKGKRTSFAVGTRYGICTVHQLNYPGCDIKSQSRSRDTAVIDRINL